jgi:hypothetical protein
MSELASTTHTDLPSSVSGSQGVPSLMGEGGNAVAGTTAGFADDGAEAAEGNRAGAGPSSMPGSNVCRGDLGIKAVFHQCCG